MSTRGGTSLRVFDPSRGRSVVGARALLSRHPSPPRLWLFYVGWGGCRVWGDVSVACGFARPDATLFWPRVSSPLLSRVPSCRVPARRFKDPGGVALPPPGSGGGGARREVGRSGGSPSDSMTLLPPLPPFPRRRSCGGVDVWSPLWAPVGARPAPPACPISAGRSCRCRSWVPVSFPCFSAPDPFFFPPHTCLVSFLAGRPEATPRSVCSPLSPGRGGRWSLGDCAVVSTREFAHTRNTDTTLSGGSLGSCVDEERS